ncbi:hypothetical protein I3843_16G030000 [Carya illinoinensis]|uniref:LOB domain-containing protein n=1 Tax=Carya illinoinensis TaxID=32201 RepID=A0A8T1N610_CARIL|nr:hypothetical protein I3760_16G028700 [Carya illinoinensis]KAG6624457.1 hypothetical protein CIPAW_16G028300 [Carya illinoinensis]KAG7941246.1 hypothetical protein I3843_16G030000 [Carya illinoinensis]
MMVGSRNASQACASCKYQRKKCDPHCPLAPFFPQHRRKDFMNVHKVFGVRNVLKLTKNLGFKEKSEAMKTMIYQADVRVKDPVGGCCRVISELQNRIKHLEAEYRLLLEQLAVCRVQKQAKAPHLYKQQQL